MKACEVEGGLILTLNAGSSTVKLGFYRIARGKAQPLGRGVIDFRDEPLEFRVSLPDGKLHLPLENADPDDMTGVLGRALSALTAHLPLDRVRIIGHRVVHGGDLFTGPALIDDATLARIESLADLAPLHQPESVRLIHATRQLRPELMQTASFDTAFHATNPPVSRRFAIPRALHDQGIHRYGFHGLSYDYLARVLAGMDLPADARVVAAHLGSGASLCGMRGGRSLDSSMGFSTIDGIPMATRSGALDPGVVLHLLGPLGMSRDRVQQMLYHESGLLGVSGFEADSRELLASDRPEAAEAIALFAYRIAGEVARLCAATGGLDALVFTAGIGENQPRLRAMVADRLDWLGIALDEDANRANGLRISSADSAVRVLVIPTDEEQVIADQALSLLDVAAG